MPRRNYARLYVAAALLAVSGGFHFGYQISATNASANLMIDYFQRGFAQRYEWVLDEFQTTVSDVKLG